MKQLIATALLLAFCFPAFASTEGKVHHDHSIRAVIAKAQKKLRRHRNRIHQKIMQSNRHWERQSPGTWPFKFVQ